MADDTDDSGGVILEGPYDPDAQATVTDFIDYTEYLPSDLIRSLTLIRGLDKTYLDAAQNVHELTRIYGQLPDLPSEMRPNAQALRKQISIQLDRAINARESSCAEACRLYDVVDRHFDRLDSIKKKLESLPKPYDPSPPSAQTSFENKRSRNRRKGSDGATRLTLRVDSQEVPTGTMPKSRSRRQMNFVGFNPDSPIASTEHSDNETGSRPPRSHPFADLDISPVSASRSKKDKHSKRYSGPGTNFHNSVAGISTSNALALLEPPPEDAKVGSEDLPWLRLTEWEMTKLRKKMKKNAVWQPSEIMIHRELLIRGRGWENYRTTKAHAESNGEEFVDCDDILNNYVPGKLIRKSDAMMEPTAPEETKLSNRGMKLNEAKKLKRETMAREQAALAAAEAELAARRLGDIGSTFKSLFSSPVDHNNGTVGGSSARSSVPAKEVEKSKSPKKRKSDEPAAAETTTSTDSNIAAEAARPASKRRRMNKLTPVNTNIEMVSGPSTNTTHAAAPSATTNFPMNGTAPSYTSKKPTPTPSPTGSRPSMSASAPLASTSTPISATAIRKVSHTPTPPATRSSSRRCSTAVSQEASAVANVTSVPVAFSTREHLRRKSATPAAAKTPAPEPVRPPSATAPTAASRRSKRPAPGPVSSGQDGGAAVSYGRRKAKPAKKRAGRDQGHKESSGPKSEDIRIDEDGVLEEIDPNEPRYCLCGDVSFGTMICCENGDCDKEWFHLECVGLSDVPSRTAKWYCPDCRVKLNKGPDGIVKVGSRR
ncbi:hypothetical protein Egran_03664 [Elaphomyces granulatus]|uniref:Chromatin modification-related protein n=1 Tax=Elaphomyces granulatus TaxID=519963 RepID=A0A232LWP9_9EURO|nr:hypothetical protein Egran_03664 [Elaphomyces granulatus]